MFKFGTIGAFKQVRNNPRCKAVAQLVNGLVVLPSDATKQAPAPANAAQAQGEVYVVKNIIDKPEIRSKKDFKVEIGEFVRAFNLVDLKDLPVELDATVVSTAYASVAVGDKLCPAVDGSGKWIKADGTTIVYTNYKVYLEVLEKTTLGDQGLYCVVRVK
jgi:hypothetical protein